MSTPIVASISGLEEMSAASHASSSRNAGPAMVRSTSNGTRSMLQPLSLADALARAGDDATRALDEVLAERNKLSLETSKLSTENMRLWNLMKKIRRENDELKSSRTTSISLTSPSSQADDHNNTVAGTQYAPNGDRRRTASGPYNKERLSPTGQRGNPPAAAVPESIVTQPGALPRDASQASLVRPSSSSQRSYEQRQLDTTDSDARISVSTSEPYTPEATSSTHAPSSLPSSSSRLIEPSAIDVASTSSHTAPRSSERSRNGVAPDIAPPPRSGSLRRVALGEGSNGGSREHSSEAAPSSASSDQQKSIIQQRAAATRAQHAMGVENSAPGSRSQDHDMNGSASAASALRRGLLQGKSSSVDAAAPVSALSKDMSDMTMAADHSREASGALSLQSRGTVLTPRLDVSLFPYTTVTVAGSGLPTSTGPGGAVSTYIYVTVQPPAGIRSSQLSSWRIEKSYDDLATLDIRLREKNAESKAAQTLLHDVRLPKREAFYDHAPSKSDLRMSMIETFIRRAIEAPLPVKDDLCSFLCTDATVIPHRDPASLSKEGVLTRKGPEPGRWNAKWFVLNGDALDYFQWCNGPLLGSIRIRGAQIGRQQKNAASESDDNAYRHAFLILEARASGSQSDQKKVVRHVLCADDDDDRDDWVDVLVRAIDQLNAEAQRAREAAVPQRATHSAIAPSTHSRTVQRNPTFETTASQPNNKSDAAAWTKVDEATGKPNEIVVSPPNYPFTPQQAASAQMGQAVPSNTPPQTLAQRQARQQHQPRPASSDSDSNVAATASAAGAHARSPHADAAGRQISGSTPHPVRRALSPRREVSQPIYPADNQQQQHFAHHASSATAAAGTLERAVSPTMSSQVMAAQRAVSQPLAQQDHVQSSLASSRPSQDAAMVSTSSHDGSIKERSRPSISGPMSAAPIPVGHKFGARDDQSSSISISSSGGVSNHAMPVSSTKAEASSTSAPETKKRFWQRFGGNSEKAKSKKIFGVPLAEAIAASPVAEALDLPSVVYRCIEFLENRNAAMEEGIYRLSGSSAVIKTLTERFNTQGDVNLLASTEPDYDPHAIAGLLKQYLRELPNSVLTPELHLEFVRANDIADRRERVNELGSLVSMLPQANYSLLRTLCSHLIKIIEHQDVNRMNMRNVGIVFSPTLTIPAGVFALFLTEFDWVFYTDAKGEPAPRFIDEDILPPDEDELGIASHNIVRTPLMNSSPAMSSQSTPGGRMRQHSDARNKRNSLRYNEAEAERLLGRLARHRLSSQREDVEDAANSNTVHSPSYDEHAQAFASRFGTQYTDSPQAQYNDSGFPMPIMASPHVGRFGRSSTDPASPMGQQTAFTPTTPVMGPTTGTPRMPFYSNGHMVSPGATSGFRSYDSQTGPASPAKYQPHASPGPNRARRPTQTDISGITHTNGHAGVPLSPSRPAKRNGST